MTPSGAPERVQYLLDEQVPPAYRAQILRRSPDLVVHAVGLPGAPPQGTADPQIISWCETHGYILVTNNRHSMPVHLAEHLARGGHVPGILTFTGQESMGEILDDLELIAGASMPGDYEDKIGYLPLR